MKGLLSPKSREAFSRIRAINRQYDLLTFEPSPIFAPLMNEVKISKKILLRSANRTGKTRHCAWVAARALVDNPGHRIRIIGPTIDHIHNVLGDYLAQFLGPYLARGSYYVQGKGWNGGRARVIRLANGSICELRSLQDHPDAHSGRSCHLVIFDEPPTLAHYTENAARLVDTLADGWGCMIIAATMVNRPVAWLRDMVQGEGQPDAPPGRTAHATGWVQYVATFTRDNCPWYSQDQVDGWRATMEGSPWEWGQRIDAKWEGVTANRVLVGITAATFDTDAPAGSVRVGIGIDHGDAAGEQCAVLIAWAGSRVWALDEYHNVEIQNPEIDARGILEMLARRNIAPTSVDLAVGDVGTVIGFTGWRVNEALQGELARLTQSRRPPFQIGNPDKSKGSVDWGHRCLNYGARRGEMTVHPRCHRLAYSLRHWKGTKRGSDAHLSHMVDAFRYILIAAQGSRTDYADLRFD